MGKMHFSLKQLLHPLPFAFNSDTVFNHSLAVRTSFAKLKCLITHL